MLTGLQDKVAVVTGASRGIGAATVAALAEEGCRVVLVSRKQEALDSVRDAVSNRVPGAELLAQAAHVADEDAARAVVDAAAARFGGVDILVNNAGTNPHFGPLIDIDRPRADKTVEVNQWAPVMWTRLCVPHLRDGGGSVVNISSIGGMLTEPGIGWYNATKAALIHLTRQLAVELGPEIRVNAVAPGVVRTQLAQALWEPHEERLAEALPLGRIGEPEDIADAVVFLAGSASRWVTGQTLVVDGGTAVRTSIA